MSAFFCVWNTLVFSVLITWSSFNIFLFYPLPKKQTWTSFFSLGSEIFCMSKNGNVLTFTSMNYVCITLESSLQSAWIFLEKTSELDLLRDRMVFMATFWCSAYLFLSFSSNLLVLRKDWIAFIC